MKVHMKRPVTRTYEVLFDQADLRGFLSDNENGKGVGVTGLTITSVDQPDNRADAVLRICLTETSNA
jgi:hypothetical protein|tara:strand:- start:2126 stop:2326 length:201 start_codon:yes stop_codon:yes gene_type:complete